MAVESEERFDAWEFVFEDDDGAVIEWRGIVGEGVDGGVERSVDSGAGGGE